MRNAHNVVRSILLFMLLAGSTPCSTRHESCLDMCQGRGIESFSEAKGCKCNEYARAAYQSRGDRFCDECKNKCSPNGMKSCKFGDSTWGAGPNVCECFERSITTPAER